jgi:hypothetical protein
MSDTLREAARLPLERMLALGLLRGAASEAIRHADRSWGGAGPRLLANDNALLDPPPGSD